MPYRDDRLGTEILCDDLERELASLASLAGKTHAKGKQVRNELVATRKLLRQQGVRRRLSILEDIRIATPCIAAWDEMDGDDRVRFCGKCAKHVYDIAAMTRAEAEALIIEQEGKSTCLRIWRRPDGTVMTRDCVRGIHSRWRRAALIGLGAALAALGGLLAIFVGTKHPTTRRVDAVSEEIRKHREADVRRLANEQAEGRTFMGATQLDRQPPEERKHFGKQSSCQCQPGDPLCSCL